MLAHVCNVVMVIVPSASNCSPAIFFGVGGVGDRGDQRCCSQSLWQSWLCQGQVSSPVLPEWCGCLQTQAVAQRPTGLHPLHDMTVSQ